MEAKDFELFELTDSSGKKHSALHVPKTLPSHYDPDAAKATSDVFNILMADISGSMWSFWPHIVTGWKESIQDKLIGRTNIYAFGDEILLKREGTELTQEDFTGDGSNDLTGALRTVRHKVEECKESVVRVFIMADGAHDHGEPYPESEICQMKIPPGKTVNVYILGLGYYFPVQQSIDIRSRLHNGNTNIPYLFWAKDDDNIVDQIAEIGSELEASLIKLNLDLEGAILPGLEKTSSIHLGEYIYFEQCPEELPPMFFHINDGPPKAISTEAKPASATVLLDICRQWNSVMIQQHRNKKHVPHETFDFMESLFNPTWDILKQTMPTGNSIKSRLEKKNIKRFELEFKTIVNQAKSLISIEEQYSNELELAEAILKSTVTNRKYDTKNLRLRGHSQDDYKEDMKAFQETYEKAKDKIMTLPFPSPDDCCRVTITSTLVDLQDPDFNLMWDMNKFDFMKTFTMTGIPIYAPIRDASQINPWAMVIKHILVTPFTILSQAVLEESAALNTDSMGVEDKDVILQQDNEKTRFNAIIPIVSTSEADVLKPIVLSNIYAMMATFCILKNPHIVDYNAHIAALGCAWIKTISEFPVNSRPEFARERLESIIATAKLYMNRPSVRQYISALLSQPKQALMTESCEEFDGKTLKCESLVKPLFFAYLSKEKFSQQQVTALYRHVLFEFIGRCLSNYKMNDPESTPFTDFLCAELADPKEKKAWIQKHCKVITEAFQCSHGNLLEKFFTIEDLVPGIQKFVALRVSELIKDLLSVISISMDMKKVQKLKNPSGCGDVSWSSLQAWAQEMGIPANVVEEATSPAQIQVYICDSLQYRNSRDRLSRDLTEPGQALDIINKKVLQENQRALRRALLKEVNETTMEHWRKLYLDAHKPLVMPITKEEVIKGAQSKGIDVTHETFCKVYRYNERLRLLRNACQIQSCPHYLQPHNNFNQHLSVEREQENFPHGLHLVSHKFCSEGLNGVIEKVVSGTHSGTNERKIPSPPEANSLDYLKPEIESLLKVYDNGEKNSSLQTSQSEKQDDDDDEEEEQFYDCEE